MFIIEIEIFLLIMLGHNPQKVLYTLTNSNTKFVPVGKHLWCLVYNKSCE